MMSQATWELHHMDCRLAMSALMNACSVDSIVTDPPYHLTSIVKRFGSATAAPAQFGTDGAFQRASAGFMNAVWDGGDVAFDPAMWAEAWRVLKPGGYLLAFSGSRTYHRMVCAIEDAGFEIRDQIMWIYGSGFPKSLNVGDGRGTALKPAHEPIVVARKPLLDASGRSCTVAQCVQTWGTGAINIDASRIGRADDDVSGWSQTGAKESENRAMSGKNYAREAKPDASARFPANVIHDGSPEVLAGFPTTTSGKMRAGTVRAAQDEPGSVVYGTYGGNATTVDTPGDSGSAARFFYQAKASKSDRQDGNIHPTVKPTDLMRYLIRMVTPAGGTVLDPFTGSGSTGKAAMLEGFNFIGCEMTDEYVPIAEARIRSAQLTAWLGVR